MNTISSRSTIAFLLLISPIAKAEKAISLGANFSAPTVIGKDNVFAPSVGEIIYDSSDEKFYGRAENSSTGMGYWSLLSGSSSSALPSGAVVAFASTCPNGFLPTDGKSYSKTGSYADLYAAISTTHGNGTTGASGEAGCPGSDCFNVPDYRGRFLRGVTGTSTLDPDAATRTAMNTGGNTQNNIGSVQGQAFQTHTHIQNAHGHSIPSANGTGGGSAQLDSGNLYSNGNSSGSYASNSTTATNQTASATGATSQASSNETRPVNAYVNYCIKY